MKKILNRILPYLGISILFLFLSYGFVPQVLSGKIVNQSDISAWKGMTNEIVQHNASHPDDKTQWTNSMFGGMPTVAMYDDFEGDWTKPLYKFLLLGKRPATYFFIALLGAFLLMLSFGIDKWLSVGGAVAIAFCSYNMQIIQVGHNTKMQAIAFMPWVLASIVFTYNSAFNHCKDKKACLSRTLLGCVLFALALSMQVKANHPQITYYLAIIIFIYALSLLIWILTARKDLFKTFTAASVLLLLVGGIGIATNANKLIPTWEYTPYTMRGGSELTESNSGGLDLGYATAWSYGIEETPNLMIPNFNGGSSSGKLDRDSYTGELLSQAGYKGRELNSTLSAMPLYWGPQPFTAGPMYIGCISIFLCMFGLFIFKGKEKWWLLVSGILALFLAWGNHFMWFTKIWFEYAPMYNKFRTVSMALVILQVTVPLLAFMVLDRLIKGEFEKERMKKALLAAFGITAGFCLLCTIFPGIAGDFTSPSDSRLPEALADSLADDRRALLCRDALRSFVLIAMTFICVMIAAGTKKEGHKTLSATIICLLVLFDLFGIGKRYLNDSHFVSKKDFSDQFAERTVDSIILEDNDPDYRVLDLSVNTFNDSHQSYRHKCIGGYSPAKLQRYQDLIDNCLSTEINSIIGAAKGCGTIEEIEAGLPETPALSMLNTKYIIIDGECAPVVNEARYGNAWFVSDLFNAADAKEEISAINVLNLRETAVIGKDFSDKPASIGITSSADSIVMSSYAANELHFRYDCSQDRVAVFSEIYYPGWKATVRPEGAESFESDVFRADWTLRAMNVPAGKGEITMRFEPSSYKTGENISRISSIILIILLILCCTGSIVIKKEQA